MDEIIIDTLQEADFRLMLSIIDNTSIPIKDVGRHYAILNLRERIENILSQVNVE